MINSVQSWAQRNLFGGGPLPIGLDLLLSRPAIYGIDDARLQEVAAQHCRQGNRFLRPDNPEEFARHLIKDVPHGADPVAYLKMVFKCPQDLPATGLEYLGEFAKAAFVHPELGPLLVSHQAGILDPEDTAMWGTGVTSAGQTALLTGILTAVAEMRRTGGNPPVVIIDLDDTLLLTPSRQAAIFGEFARTRNIEKLLGIRPRHFSDYGYNDALVNKMGLDAAWVAQNRDLKDFWIGRFFSNPYLLLDTPALGAVDYLHRLQEAGAVIVYLTGRDETNMRAGTEAALELHGFPHPGNEGVTLMMKDQSNQAIFTADMDEATRRAIVNKSDLAYKRGVIERAQRLGAVIAAIDNEAGMANLFRRELPAATVIRINTSQSKAEPLSKGVGLIDGFLL